MLIPGLNRFAASLLLLVAPALTVSTPADATSTDQAIDFARIQQYARLSTNAYQIGSGLDAAQLPDGHSLSVSQIIDTMLIGFMITTDDATGEQYIAVRGTENIDNALVDISLKLRQDERAGIKLHSGFAAAAQAIYLEVEPRLDRDKVVHTTGHSLGGAVALILAMYLDRDGFRVGEIVTFGQPKVTNLGGSKTYQHLNLLRIVTPLDPVPIVPPLDPLDLRNLDIYWHPGREILLNTDQSYSVLQGGKAMLRATRFTQRMLDRQNLEHHRMSLYLDLIDNKTTSATEVPFRNNLNLFNLFGNKEQASPEPAE